MVLDAVHNDFECERTVILVHRNLDNQAEAQVVAEGKARDFDVVQEAGPNVECLCKRIHFDVPGDECTLNPHESRLEHALHLDLQLWPKGFGGVASPRLLDAMTRVSPHHGRRHTRSVRSSP